MMYPGRCGTCKNFPGKGGKRCPKNTREHMSKVWALDYGKGSCDNYDTRSRKI